MAGGYCFQHATHFDEYQCPQCYEEVHFACIERIAELERKAAAWDEVCHKVGLCMQNDVTGYAVVQLVKLFREQEARDA